MADSKPQAGTAAPASLTAKDIVTADAPFREIFTHSLDGILFTDPDGSILAANPAACDILGRTEEDICRLGRAAVADSRDPRLLSAIDERARTGFFRGELTFLRSDGTPFPVELSTRVFSSGPLAQRTAIIFKDISDRQRADEALTRSHDLLLNLARLVPGVIYQYRLYPDGRSAFPYSSPGMNLIYEVTPEDVQEDATPVFGRLHPDDYDMVAAAIQESAQTLQTFYCEFRVILPRQGLRWRWSQAQPERTDDGGTLWHGIILDVTDRKEVELEKEALSSQLRQAQKMESIGRLAGGVAHDFNNMLGVILGHTELAIDRVRPDAAIHADLSQILQAAKRSADLTRQLLAYARKQTIAPQVLDLNSTVVGMATMLQRLIGEDIRLDCRPAANLWRVKMDPSQIDQLLANLCVNARDAIAGIGHVSIQMENAAFDADYCAMHAGFESGDFVRLSVTDDGCGMSNATLSHLFEPFFTTKAIGQGTGLGLATVYGIVKQNDGFINVSSEPGRGTTMAVYFRRHFGEDERPASDHHAVPAVRGHETILLVEDEPAMLNMATIVLEALGYRVLAARSPEEAIALADRHAADISLLLTDVIMPEMNGRDLAAHVLSRHSHIKHLFMSGHTADVIARQGILNEGVPFIQKPFSKSLLAAKVREVLDEGQ